MQPERISARRGPDKFKGQALAEDDQVDVIYRWINPLTGQAKLERILRVDQNVSLGRMNCATRFRDNNELRYSLRSVARHAPWVRTIHIIGEGPPPDWLRIEAPIVWVDHDALLQANGQDPQLNSETQKLYFATLPDLAERFLYFDDDWFLGADLSEADFFTGDGTPIHPSAVTLMGGHAPQAWTRTAFKQGLNMLPAALVEAVRNAGIARLDPTLTMRELLRQTGDIVTAKKRNAQIWLREVNVRYYRSVLRQILEKRPKIYCVNDDWSLDHAEYAEQMRVLNAFFVEMYPDAAAWEKRSGTAGVNPATA